MRDKFSSGPLRPRPAAPYAIGPASVGWAIVGAGHSAAPRLIAALRTLPPAADDSVRAWPVALCSHSAARAQEFAYTHSLAFATTDLATLLARPDVRCVYIANHPRHHAESVAVALDAGKHVLCEPPLALTPAESAALAQRAAQRGLVLGLNYQQRHDPALLTLRTWLHSHALGDLVGGSISNSALLPGAQQSWRVLPAWGGVVLDRTLRTVDAVRFLTGEQVTAAGAAAGPRAFGSDAGVGQNGIEVLHSLLALPRSGATIHAFDAYLTPYASPRIELYGTIGAAVVQPWQPHHASALYIQRHGSPLHPANSTESSAHTGADADAAPADLWAEQMLAFLAAVNAGTPAPTPPADDQANLAVCLNLLQQAGAPLPAA